MMDREVQKKVNRRMFTVLSKIGEIEDIVLENGGDFEDLPASWQSIKQELEMWIMTRENL